MKINKYSEKSDGLGYIILTLIISSHHQLNLRFSKILPKSLSNKKLKIIMYKNRKPYSLLLIFIISLYSSTAISYPLHIIVEGNGAGIIIIMNDTTPIIVYSNTTINVNGSVTLKAFSLSPYRQVVPNYVHLNVSNEITVKFKVVEVNATHQNLHFDLPSLTFDSNILGVLMVILGLSILLLNRKSQ